MRKAFTLIELLVVVGIIAILVGILIPALGRAQTSARLVKSQANLRSLAQIQEVYTGEYRDSLMVPFEIEKFIANGNGGGTFGAGWGRVRKVGTNIGIEFPDGQGGNNTPFYSEFYAFHWYSVIGGWLNMGDYASEVQFAPADRVIIQRMQDLQDDPPRGWTLDTGFWDGSYILSPTIWFSPNRYRENQRPNAIRNDAIRSMAKRNKISSVAFPSQKVMMWERFDWTKKRRNASYLNPSIGIDQPVQFGEERFPPQWNNIEAEPSVATADGSVSRVKISDIFDAMRDDNERVARSFSPTDEWDAKYTTLRFYSMHEDGFEIGDERTGMGKYPAFFWATRDGIQGRDFAR